MKIIYKNNFLNNLVVQFREGAVIERPEEEDPQSRKR